MPNCLLCGSGVWYVGLFNADCTNSGCTNFREPPPKPGQEYGSWAWAVKAQREGWSIEFCRVTAPNVWHALINQLAATNGDAKLYEFRIHQAVYAPPSEYKRGTQEWSEDMSRKGLKLRLWRGIYEVIP